MDTRLAAISKREQTKRRHGRKRVRDEFNPIRGSLEAERALEIIQIDHTPADLMAAPFPLRHRRRMEMRPRQYQHAKPALTTEQRGTGR